MAQASLSLPSASSSRPRAERGRGQGRALGVGGDAFELDDGLGRVVELAGSNSDLYSGGQEPCPGEAAPGLLGEQAGDDGLGGVDPALGETDQGEPCAVQAAQLVRLGEGFLCALEVTQPAANLTDLDVAGGDVRDVEAVELGARSSRFAFGGRPVAMELQQRSVVDSADARPHGQRVAL